MATKIRVECRQCGLDTKLDPDQIQAVAFGNLTDVHTGSYYRFNCPTCGTQTKHADEQIISILRTGGVPIQWKTPAPVRQLPPITWNELLDFHQALQQPGWFQRLTEGAA